MLSQGYVIWSSQAFYFTVGSPSMLKFELHIKKMTFKSSNNFQKFVLLEGQA